MSVGKYLQNSALVALAAAIVASGIPSVASAREEGDRRSNNAMDRRAEIVREGNAQRAQQAPRRSEPRAQQAQPRPAPVAQQAAAPARQGNWQGQRADRGGDQRANQGQQRGGQAPTTAQQGNWRQQAQRPDRQQAQRPDRRAEPTQQAQRDTRSGTYTDQNRNRSYTDANRRNNSGWQRNDRQGDSRYADNNRRDNDGWRGDRRDNQRWDRGWRNNNRYDWQRYRTTNRVVFHVGTYYSPYRNYSYRRLGVGGFLDSLFFGSRYWINDPWQYRLPEVYGPYRWVRYYDDVLLVDVYSGAVVDVIYDFFW